VSENIPSPDFNTPHNFAPIAGYVAGDDYDAEEFARSNANSNNEARYKLQHLLSFLSGFNENIIVGADGKKHAVLSKNAGSKKLRLPPFTVLLGKEANGQHYVQVTEGYVIQRNLSAGLAADDLAYFQPDNHYEDPPDDDKLRKFPIQIGQAVYIAVGDDAYGNINGDSVEIIVDANYKVSTMLIPARQAGLQYYKLAVLVTDPVTQVKLEYWAAGSHIYQPTGLTADVRWMDCPIYGVSPTEFRLRMSFVSGSLVSLGESLTDRPLSPVDYKEYFEHCS